MTPPESANSGNEETSREAGTPGRKQHTHKWEETDQAFVEAGVRLLSEGAPVGDVRHQLHVKDVVEAAGKSLATFHNHFASHEEYVARVLDHALNTERVEQTQGPTLEFLANLLATGAGVEDLAVHGARMNFQRTTSEQALLLFRLQFGLVARAHVDEAGRQRVEAMYRKLTDLYEQAYEGMLSSLGLRLRGCTTRQFAVIMTALFEGLVLRFLADPDSVGGYEGGADLAAEAALNLVRGMTEPDE